MRFYYGFDESFVQYSTHMGTDDTVCDAARVSMDKTAVMFSPTGNERLINYLAKHNHWSPFAHVQLQLRMKAPIFIARQLQKHQIGFAWNEVSRRYVSTTPEVWLPDYFREKADNVKQGSTDTASVFSNRYLVDSYKLCTDALVLYNNMIEDKVCAEQARAVLPQCMITEWMWTGSLYAWSRLFNLRADPHSQREVQQYAHAISTIARTQFPLSWRALSNYDTKLHIDKIVGD